MSDKAIEVPFRVDGGVWSDRALVEPTPPSPWSLLLEEFGRHFAEPLSRFLEAATGVVEELGRVWRQATDQGWFAGERAPNSAIVVKPAKCGKTFLAWRYDRWVPVHRERGRGWVWSE